MLKYVREILGVVCLLICNAEMQVSLNTCSDLESVKVSLPAILSASSRSLSFGLNVKPLKCKHKQTMELVTTEGRSSGNSRDAGLFLKDGHLLVRNSYYAVTDYCIQKITSDGVTLELCGHPCGDDLDTVCVPKCCELDKVIDGFSKSGSCQFSDLPWTPILYKADTQMASGRTLRMRSGKLLVMPGQTPVRVANSTSFNFKFELRSLNCSEKEIVTWSLRNLTGFGFQNMQFRFLSNSSVVFFNDSKWNLLESNFCIDGVQNYGMNVFYTGSLWDQVVRFCPNELPEFSNSSENDRSTRTVIQIAIPIVYGVVMFCSCALLSVTLLVYFLLRNKQKFHMWVVASYIISILLLNMLFGTSNILSQLSPSTNDTVQGNISCVIIGAATHLFILSTFIWLTFLNLNIWVTFRTLISSASLSIQRHGFKRFLKFSIAAWGFPVVVVSIGLILDCVNRMAPSPYLFGPGYGIGRCLISRRSEGFYLFYPIGILVIFNASIFLFTIFRISLYQELTTQLKTGNSKNNLQWRLIRIYTSLLLMSSSLWMTEFIAWNFRWDTTIAYWILIDLLNFTQSLAIFIVFVCRKQTWGNLEQRYPTVKKASMYFSTKKRRPRPKTETEILLHSKGCSTQNSKF